jgi:hypothetical protein
MGINFDANDNFKLILGSGGKDLTIPMQFAMDGPSANYLTFDFRPENDSDTFRLKHATAKRGFRPKPRCLTLHRTKARRETGGQETIATVQSRCGSPFEFWARQTTPRLLVPSREPY